MRDIRLNPTHIPGKIGRFRLWSTMLFLSLAVAFLRFKNVSVVPYACPSFTPSNRLHDKTFHLDSSLHNWVLNLSAFGSLITVRNETGLIDAIFKRIPPKNKLFVEFGFGYVNDGLGTDAFNKSMRYLKSNYLSLNGWKGWKFDAEVEYSKEGIYKEHLAPGTIVETFNKYNIPRNVDFMCIDVDSIDIWLFIALLKDRAFRPTLINIEYNCHFPYESLVACQPEWEPWVRDIVYGASAGAILFIAEKEGYVPVYSSFGRHKDLFLIHRDELERTGARGLTIMELERLNPLPKRLHYVRPDSKLGRFINVKTYTETGNIQLARECAKSDILQVKQKFSK